jgi:hypothetical protein
LEPLVDSELEIQSVTASTFPPLATVVSNETSTDPEHFQSGPTTIIKEEPGLPSAIKMKEEHDSPSAITIKEEPNLPSAIKIKDEPDLPSAIKIKEEPDLPSAIKIKEELSLPFEVKIKEELSLPLISTVSSVQPTAPLLSDPMDTSTNNLSSIIDDEEDLSIASPVRKLSMKRKGPSIQDEDEESVNDVTGKLYSYIHFRLS